MLGTKRAFLYSHEARLFIVFIHLLEVHYTNIVRMLCEVARLPRLNFSHKHIRGQVELHIVLMIIRNEQIITFEI